MRARHGTRIALTLALVGACRDHDATDDGADDSADDDASGGDDDADSDGDGASVVPLAPVDRLVRVSMALRGKRPSRGDIEAVEADPEVLSDIVDLYLVDPAFGETIRDMHNEALLVLADYFIYPAGFEPVGPLVDADVYALNRSITEAPLRLVEHVVMNDRPYTEIVTAEYTIANADVATVWGLAHEGDEWSQTSWTDGRGNAGILSDSWLFQRHSSTPSNANRGRANAISRALLCYDFLSRDIEVDAEIDLADPEEVANAVVENPACASCHQALDPLASFFRGYYPIYLPSDLETYPHYVWYPELFPDLLGVPMRDAAFFGSTGDGVESLGRLIADDPRFSLCTARRFYAYFHQIDLADVPMDAEIELQELLIANGMNAKALTKAIVLSDDFLVSHVELPPDLHPEDLDPAADVVGVKKARPVQLRQLFADLTGFHWRTDLTIFASPELPWGLGKVDLMDDSFLGYSVLAGGLDSIYVTRASHTYSATVSLVLRTMAQLAAGEVVDSDFALPAGDRRLLGLVEPDTVDDASVRAQLVDLHLRLFAERIPADDAVIDETLQLWSAARDHGGDPRRAWKVVLAALLQDMRIAYY